MNNFLSPFITGEPMLESGVAFKMDSRCILLEPVEKIFG